RLPGKDQAVQRPYPCHRAHAQRQRLRQGPAAPALPAGPSCNESMSILDCIRGIARAVAKPSGGFMTGKRRHVLTIFLLTAFAVADASAEKIRTSIPGANLNYLSVYSADERHFFRDEGFDNKTIASGAPAGIAALVSGDVDFSGAGGSGLRGAVRGAPLKAIF